MLRPGLVLTIGLEGATARYTAKVVANTREVIAVATPHDRADTEQRWPKGAACLVGFTRESDGGYSFASKVVGYSTVRGTRCTLLQHAKSLRREQQRHSRRRELARPCFCYPILITQTGSGRRAVRKAVISQKDKVVGTIADISAGGCSVRTQQPFKPGTLLKVELSIERGNTVAAYGKVQRVRPERLGGVMHIMFTRISAAASNRIYTYVYDYAT
jgi:hypothetical protein